MPVIGRADDNGGEVRPPQQFTVVAISIDFPAPDAHPGRELLDHDRAIRHSTRIQVTHGDHLGQIRPHDTRHIMSLPDPTAVDVTDAHPIAWGIGPPQP